MRSGTLTRRPKASWANLSEEERAAANAIASEQRAKRRAKLKTERTKRASGVMAPSVKDLDKLWSELVKLEAGRECQMWGVAKRQCSSVLNSHHVFSRRHWATRFDVENGLCICSGHHYWVHHEPTESTEEIKDLIGLERYERLRASHLTGKKPTAAERREIASELRRRIVAAKAVAA